MRPIDADELKTRLANLPGGYAQSFAGKACLMEIEATPTIDYAPVVHGEWIPVWHDLFKLGYVKCSVCGHKEKKGGWAYCHCGAKMDGGKNDG